MMQFSLQELLALLAVAAAAGALAFHVRQLSKELAGLAAKVASLDVCVASLMSRLDP